MNRFHERQKNLKEFIEKKLPLILFIILSLVVILRSFFGICWQDEAGYLAVAQRYFNGDIPFVDDWWTVSLYGIFTLPLYALYVTLAGSTDGIILFFRIFTGALWVCVCGYLYGILVRKCEQCRWNALLAAGTALLLVTDNLYGISYYSVILICFLLSVLLIYDERRRHPVNYIFVGVLMSFVIICNPYMAVFYFLASILAVVYSLIKKDKDFFRSTALIWLGSALIFIAFMIYLVTRPCSLTEIITSIPNMFNADHNPLSSQGGLGKFYTFCWYFTVKDINLTGLFVAAALLTAVIRYITKAKTKFYRISSLMYMLVITGWMILKLAVFVAKSDNIGDMLFFFAEYTMLLLPIVNYSDKTCEKIKYFYVPGAVLMLAQIFSSDLGMRVGAMGAVIMLVSGYDLFGNALLESAKTVDSMIKKEIFCKLAVIFKYLVLAIILINSLYLRVMIVFPGGVVTKYDTLVKEGPAKGIFAMSEDVRIYNDLYDFVSDNISHERIISNYPMVFLMSADMNCATYSPWPFLGAEAVVKMIRYRDCHEEYAPAAAVLVDSSGESFNYNEYTAEDIADIYGSSYTYEHKPFGEVILFR